MADFLSVIEQIAPTVATCLGGPLAGLAVEAVSKAIGVPQDQAQALIDSGKMTSDQIAQLKMAEIDLQKQAQTLGLDFEKLAVDDRKSARDMQASTKSWVPSMLAIAVTVGFFGILSALMFGQVQKSDPLLVMLGSLGTAWVSIISFYFGSSKGSEDKNQILLNQMPK